MSNEERELLKEKLINYGLLNPNSNEVTISDLEILIVAITSFNIERDLIRSLSLSDDS